MIDNGQNLMHTASVWFDWEEILYPSLELRHPSTFEDPKPDLEKIKGPFLIQR